MAETNTLGWGRPDVYVKKLGESEAAWNKLPTPVDGTTSLTTTQGEKMEAKIEGGDNEAVKYKANTYELSLQIRLTPEKEDELSVIQDVDGVVAGEYSVMVIPENPAAVGVQIDRASVNVQTAFGSADGTVNTYTFSALKPETGNTVKFDVLTAPSTGEA